MGLSIFHWCPISMNAAEEESLSRSGIIARQHSCNYGESKNHWSKYCRKEEHNYHRRVSSITKLLYSLSSSEFRRGEKVIDLHINQATFNTTETSKSSWKNWLEDKSIGATIYVSRTTPFEILSFCTRCVLLGVQTCLDMDLWAILPKITKVGQVRLVAIFLQFRIFVTFWSR